MKLSVYLIALAAFVGLSPRANATTYYYLVGFHHDFLLDAYPDPNESRRMDAEEAYAATVESAQKAFDVKLDEVARTGDDVDTTQIRDDAQRSFEKTVADASAQRDYTLSQMYQSADNLIKTAPNMRLLQDGPYQVMGLDVQGPTNTYAAVRFMPLYVGYTGANAFGVTAESYGVPLPYSTYMQNYRTYYYEPWAAAGRPYFGTFHHRDREDFEVEVLVRSEVMAKAPSWPGGVPPRLTLAERVALRDQATAYERARGQETGAPRLRSAYSPIHSRPSSPVPQTDRAPARGDNSGEPSRAAGQRPGSVGKSPAGKGVKPKPRPKKS